MRVDIWSEITCPWCGLSSHRLDRAVERLEHRDQVDVVHHPFPLSSSFSKDRTLGIREAMMAKYGVIPEQAGAPDIESMAAAEGLALYRVLDIGVERDSPDHRGGARRRCTNLRPRRLRGPSASVDQTSNAQDITRINFRKASSCPAAYRFLLAA
ncbi:DsbA family protein [Mycobacteroides abscessus]|uniref:DsbA family protein n=2 Tax=Mycobacteroides abscessus TaxID=36809 RepID=UPI0009A94907|nr:DsbA family protein [Mycobacteroides abscessus]MBN7315329.1 DsbA family protein [Mycobacteroides abscessus subsp. massiliense]